MVLAAVGVGGQVLAAVFEPANGMAATKREPAEADFLGEQNGLVAEAAADVGRDDADAAFFQAEAFGEAGADDMRHLARGVENELVGAVVEHGDAAAPLDRRHALATRRDRARDLDRRIEGRRDPGVDRGLEKDVVAPMLVHEGRARLARRPHVVDGREFLEIQRHARRDVLGFSARRRDAHGDQLADMPHLAGRQRRLLGDLEARQPRHRPDRLDAVQIRRREHPVPNSSGISMPRMRACASGLRTKATSCMPGRRMSPTYWPKPRMRRSSSLRGSRAPTPSRASGSTAAVNP